MKPAGVTYVDGEAVDFGGMTFGIVGGGVRTPLGIPGEVTDEEYDAKLERIGPVDVVCTHMPPRLPWYTYDVVAGKFEPGSEGSSPTSNGINPRMRSSGMCISRSSSGATLGSPSW